MTVEEGISAAPGWYPDPVTPTQARWWNGIAWTANTTALRKVPPRIPTYEEYRARLAADPTPADRARRTRRSPFAWIAAAMVALASRVAGNR